MQSGKKKKAADCLAIVGTEPGCGKTVLMSGMAGALREQGFNTRAMKPILLTANRASESESSFISSVSHTPINYQQICVETAKSLSDTAIHNAINQNRVAEAMTLIELPGGAATPVYYADSKGAGKSIEWQDTTNIAAHSKLPCILVAKHNACAIEQLVVSAYYLTMQRVFIVGLATVETSFQMGAEIENKIRREDFAMALLSRTGAPYLGCIKHSLSVSVPRCNQGNLVRLTTAGLDLLTVIKGLDLPLPIKQP